MTIASLAAGLALLTALLAFGLRHDPSLIRSPLLGRRAPGFTLQTLDGKSVSLAELRGQVVVVNFWASWCAACREEHPDLVAAWNRYRDRGVVFVGILYQDSAEKARQFLQEMGGDWPNLIDPGGETSIAYGVYGVPETFFIDRDGVVRHKQIGPSSFGLLSGQIDRLL